MTYALKLYLRALVIAGLTAAAAPNLTAQAMQTSVTKDGITWTFDRAAIVGQFVNGDYYVVGPVTVTSISPTPTKSAPLMHGSVLNLPSANGKSGFDQRLNDGIDQSHWFDASLRKYPPIALKPGDALVSSISLSQIHSVPEVMRSMDKSFSPVRTVSILTVLSDTPAPQSFRPSYCDRAQRIYSASQLNRSLLPSLPKPNASSTPSLAQFETWFRRPWIDTNKFLFDAPAEYMPSYSQRVAFAGSIAALLLTLDFPAEQKVNLTNYFVQYGIDLFGCLESGFDGWPAFGGHGLGRKLPIIFAGTLLNDSRMKQVSSLYPDKFGEDMQTMYVTQVPPVNTYTRAWQGALAIYGGHYGIRDNGQIVEPGAHGPYEHLMPRNWPRADGQLRGEVYRRCCTSTSWVGQALAAKLIGAEGTWDHAPFFAYVHRWMTEDDAQAISDIRAQTGEDFSGNWMRQKQTQYALQGGFPQHTFIDDMWRSYKDYTPGPPPPVDTAAPSVPAGLSATAASSTQIDLGWSASTDNGGVTGYRVYRGSSQIATVASTAYSDRGLTPGSSYTYKVAAYDAAGNVSAQSAAVSATTPTIPAPTRSLAAAYGLEAQSGTVAADSSGNANNGAVSTATWVPAKHGRGLAFAGNGSVRIPPSPSLDITGAGTIQAWVKPATLNKWHGIIAKGDRNSEPAHNYALEIAANNRVICSVGNGANAAKVVSASSVVAGQFTHLACTWDGTTMRLYVNATLSASAAQPIQPTANAAPLLLSMFGGNVDYFNGTLDEVRIYKGALTAAEILTDMHKPVVAATPDTSAPAVPAGLTGQAVSPSQINLSWAPSTDNVGVVGYRIFRGGTQVATSATNRYSNTGLTAGASYTYRVAAYDAAGNVSSQSAAITIVTPAAPVGVPAAASYRLETQTGSAVNDSSGNANHGTRTGGVWATGRLGGGLSLSGTSSVTVPDAASLDIASSGTIHAWVKPNVLGIWHGLISKGNRNAEAAHNYSLEITPPGKAICAIGNGSRASAVTSTATVAVGQFTNLSCTWDGTSMKLYVNGVLDSTANQAVVPAQNSSPLFLGKFADTDYMNGVLDEVRIYRGALTAAQIQAEMLK